LQPASVDRYRWPARLQVWHHPTPRLALYLALKLALYLAHIRRRMKQ